MSYALELFAAFTWTVRVQGQLVNIYRTPLAVFPCTIQSVATVSEVIQSLNCSHFCTGNADSQFFPLQVARKGVFMDSTGKYSYFHVDV